MKGSLFPFSHCVTWEMSFSNITISYAAVRYSHNNWENSPFRLLFGRYHSCHIIQQCSTAIHMRPNTRKYSKFANAKTKQKRCPLRSYLIGEFKSPFFFLDEFPEFFFCSSKMAFIRQRELIKGKLEIVTESVHHRATLHFTI